MPKTIFFFGGGEEAKYIIAIVPWPRSLDDMSTRIDDLEKNIGELMNQAVVDEPEKWQEQMASQVIMRNREIAKGLLTI